MSNMIPPVDIEAELAALLGDEPMLVGVANSVSLSVEYWKARIPTVRSIAFDLKKNRPISPPGWKKIAAYLAALHNPDLLHPRLK